MGLAFVCAKEEEQGPDRRHATVIVMKRCPRCQKQAVAGYWCEEEGCEHEDVDAEEQLWGHGEGKCEPAGSDSGSSPAQGDAGMSGV